MPLDQPVYDDERERLIGARHIIKAGEQSADDPLEFVMSDGSEDRMGDVIDPDGWDLRAFRKNPIALFQHRHAMPIGVWRNLRVEDGKLMGRLQIAKAGTSALVDEIRALVEQRILRAVSVGFRPIEVEDILDKEGRWTGGFLFKTCELVECSLVSVPANANALATAKSLGVSREALRLVFREFGPPGGARKPVASIRRPSRTAPSGSKPAVASPRTKEHPMDDVIDAQRGGEAPGTNLPAPRARTTKERLESAKSRQLEIKEQIANIEAAANEEGRDLSDDEAAVIAELADEFDGLQKQAESWERMERIKKQALNGTSMTPVSRSPAPKKPSAPSMPAQAREKKPMEVLSRALLVQWLAKKQSESAVTVAERMYGDDPRVEAVIRSTVNPASTTTTGWAAELMRTETRELLDELKAVSVFGRLAALGQSLDFGNASTITVPRRVKGNLAGSFVKEGGPIPVMQGQLLGVTFSRHKAAAIVALTEEVLTRGVDSAERMIREGLIEDTANAIDTAMLDANAATAGLRPAGLLNGVTGAASAGNDQAGITADLKALFTTLAKANAGRRPVIIMNPARMWGLSLLTSASGAYVFRDAVNQGRLLGAEIIASTNVAQGNIIVLDAYDFAAANADPMFSVSDQATLVMANADGTDPTMDTAAGTLKVSDAAGAVVPAIVSSMFQQNMLAIRMTLEVCWGMTRPGLIELCHTAGW